MAKVRVYELAKELGVESKVLLEHLKSQGEFVRAASSTIEAPVVRRIRESFPAELAGGAKKSGGDSAPASPQSTPAGGAPKPAGRPGPVPGPAKKADRKSVV